MDHTVFFDAQCRDRGIRLVAEYNCYDPPYDPVVGWPLKLPDVEFDDRTLVLLHLQDFVTVTDNGILELDRIQQHYGDRSDRVIVTHWPHALYRHYTGALNLIEFNSHEYNLVRNIQKDWSRFAWITDQKRIYRWQCLNGRRCPHRLRAVQVLQDLTGGVISYGDVMPLDQWNYSTYRGTENEENYHRLGRIYGRADVNIVTETQYDRAPGIITEKTLLALLSEQIPLVIGYPGIVRDCMELGFDMFDDVVDVSYDSMPNGVRVEQAIQRNLTLLKGEVDLEPYRERLRLQRRSLLEHYERSARNRFETELERVVSRLGW